MKLEGGRSEYRIRSIDIASENGFSQEPGQSFLLAQAEPIIRGTPSLGAFSRRLTVSLRTAARAASRNLHTVPRYSVTRSPTVRRIEFDGDVSSGSTALGPRDALSPCPRLYPGGLMAILPRPTPPLSPPTPAASSPSSTRSTVWAGLSRTASCCCGAAAMSLHGHPGAGGQRREQPRGLGAGVRTPGMNVLAYIHWRRGVRPVLDGAARTRRRLGGGRKIA